MIAVLVSIVTISKNHCLGLSKTLDSVNQQNYQNIEHIVIDGNSNDSSKDLLNSYCHSKKYIHFSEPDRGISNAFNKGLDKSNGDLIFFLNSGDIFFSDTVISEIVESYRVHQWKCAVGTTLTTNLAVEPVFYQPPQLSSKFLNYFMFLPHQGFFCEMSLHKSFRYDESLKISMDYDLFLRMLKDIEVFYLPTVISISEAGGVASQSHKRISEQSQIRLRYTNNIQERFIITIINFMIWLKNYLKIDAIFTSKI